MDDQNISPLNPLPVVVWALVLPIIAMEIVLSLGEGGLVGGPQAIGWRQEAYQRFAFAPEYFRQMVQARAWSLEGLMRLVTYPLVSLSTTSTLFVVVMTLALGKFVGEVFRGWAIVVIFLAAVVVGALAYAAVPSTQFGLVSAYPGVYGLIGGFSYVLWRQQKANGRSQLRAFRMILFFMGIRLVYAIFARLMYGPDAGVGMDWVAELAGFAIGFVLSFVVSPGGWVYWRNRLRGR